MEKLCEILEVFNAVKKVISGSDYQTFNLFLNKVHLVKMLLGKRMSDEDKFIQAMIGQMKAKFNRYWGNTIC